MRHLEIKLDPLGQGTVELDGIDVSSYTNGIELRSYPHEPTTVVLSIVKGMSIDFGQAIPNLVIECDCPHCGQPITVDAK